MTLPSSPPITMLQIRTECGAPVGTPLNQFYQGGPWFGTGGTNTNLPTQAPINMLNLLGCTGGGATSGFNVTLSQPSLSVSGTSGVITTFSVVATANNAPGPVTFQWFQVSGDVSISVTARNSSTTAFSGNISGGNSLYGVFQCKCTSGSSVTYSPTINVSILYRNQGHFIP